MVDEVPAGGGIYGCRGIDIFVPYEADQTLADSNIECRMRILVRIVRITGKALLLGLVFLASWLGIRFGIEGQPEKVFVLDGYYSHVPQQQAPKKLWLCENGDRGLRRTLDLDTG